MNQKFVIYWKTLKTYYEKPSDVFGHSYSDEIEKANQFDSHDDADKFIHKVLGRDCREFEIIPIEMVVMIQNFKGTVYFLESIQPSGLQPNAPPTFIWNDKPKYAMLMIKQKGINLLQKYLHKSMLVSESAFKNATGI